jgi:hypothetical protein
MSNPFWDDDRRRRTGDGDVTRYERYVAVGALYMRERVVGGYPFGIFYYSREQDVKLEDATCLRTGQRVESSRLGRIVDNLSERILTGERRGYIL